MLFRRALAAQNGNSSSVSIRTIGVTSFFSAYPFRLHAYPLHPSMPHPLSMRQDVSSGEKYLKRNLWSRDSASLNLRARHLDR